MQHLCPAESASTAAYAWRHDTGTCEAGSQVSSKLWSSAYTDRCAFHIRMASKEVAVSAMQASLVAAQAANLDAHGPGKIDYDIIQAAQRQRIFNYQVALPHFCDAAFLHTAVCRCACCVSLLALMHARRACLDSWCCNLSIQPADKDTGHDTCVV